jgi:5'-nucleotidase
MSLPLLLITNDDGVDSYFLRVLAEAHRPHFHVCVAAPKHEQSWIGRAFSRLRDVRVEERKADFADEIWSVDGTPSDCVNIALGHLLGGRRPDVVISGINIGFNITMPLSLSSGTLAGAIEGAAWGIPAAAFSLELPDAEYLHAQRNKGEIAGVGRASLLCAAARAVRFTLDCAGEGNGGAGGGVAGDAANAANSGGDAVADNAAAAAVRVHNINFPRICDAETPVERTVPADARLGVLYREEAPGVFRFHWNKSCGDIPVPADTDAACLRRGHISHGLLDFNRAG